MIEPESVKELISLSCSPLIQFFTFTYWQLLTMTLLFPVLHSMPYAVLESYLQLLEFFLCIPPLTCPRSRLSAKRRLTGDRVVLGSNLAAATSLRTFGNSVYPTLSVSFGETLKAVGPFYLVSMPGQVKDPTR